MELQGFLTNLGKYDEGYLVGEWVTFPIEEDVMDALMDALGDFEDALDVYESDSYVFYPGWSIRDVAEDVADEYLDSILQGSALDFVKSHFDYDEYANELECEGYYTTDNGVIEIY